LRAPFAFDAALKAGQAAAFAMERLVAARTPGACVALALLIFCCSGCGERGQFFSSCFQSSFCLFFSGLRDAIFLFRVCHSLGVSPVFLFVLCHGSFLPLPALLHSFLFLFQPFFILVGRPPLLPPTNFRCPFLSSCHPQTPSTGTPGLYAPGNALTGIMKNLILNGSTGTVILTGSNNNRLGQKNGFFVASQVHTCSMIKSNNDP
jgi:hypothetical protein